MSIPYVFFRSLFDCIKYEYVYVHRADVSQSYIYHMYISGLHLTCMRVRFQSAVRTRLTEESEISGSIPGLSKTFV